MQDGIKLRIFLFGAVFLIITAILLVIIFNGVKTLLEQASPIESQPLILLKAPFDQETVSLGDGVLVYATARAATGIKRIEFWADGEFISSRQPEDGESMFPAVLADMWEAQTEGPHILAVRAITPQGTAGQASVRVQVGGRQEDQPTLAAYFVGEDETLTGISAGLAVDSLELIQLNPWLAEEELRPGDVLLYPFDTDAARGDDPETPISGLLPGEGDPPQEPVRLDPQPAYIEPVSFFHLPNFLQKNVRKKAAVRVEILSLISAGAYESLHCYLALGDGLSQRYPDADQDQLTHESFVSLSSGVWDAASYLAGDRGPLVLWTTDQPLPLQMECIGIQAGGSDAVGLGSIDIAVYPEKWDGIRRSAVGEGGEGLFFIDYRISLVREEIRQAENLARPYALVLEGNTLFWDYPTAPAGEEPDGFNIYLNGTLLWAAGPQVRSLDLPVEWLNLACGEELRFTVSAFLNPYPGRESRPSEALVYKTSGTVCERTLLVTFKTLQTYDYLQAYDPDGGVGPLYGSFYVNDQVLLLDGRPEFYLQAGKGYRIGDLFQHYAAGQAELLVKIGAGEDLWLGYDLYDADSQSADERICHSEILIPNERLSEPLDDWLGDWIAGNCGVSYSLQLTPGAVSLPRLEVSDLVLEKTSGQLQIFVRNVGTAAWEDQDLDLIVRSRAGQSLGTFSAANLRLLPGEEVKLQWPDLKPESGVGVCVILDPDNKVSESGEGNSWTAHSYCYPLADLLVRDVFYQQEEGRLLVSVQNQSPAVLKPSELGLRITLEDASFFNAPAEWWPDLTLEPYESIVLEWPGIGTEQRALMKKGYTVELDPLGKIPELDETNNSYTVPAAARMRLVWYAVNSSYYSFRLGRAAQQQTFSLQVYKGCAGCKQEFIEWTYGPLQVEEGYGNKWLLNAYTQDFEIAGDENLYLAASGEVSYRSNEESLGALTYTFEPGEIRGTGENCLASDIDSQHIWTVYPLQTLWTGAPPWSLSFLLCRIE